MTLMSLVLPGDTHTRTGMHLAGDGEADDDLRQIGAMVLGVPVGAKRRLALGAGRVGFVALEVRAGGVEEQQDDLEAQQVRAREEYLWLYIIAILAHSKFSRRRRASTCCERRRGHSESLR